MLEAGIALDQALKTVAEQSTQERMKRVLRDLCQRVQRGQPFHQALAQHRQYFPAIYINLVKVGETSGKLDEIMAYLLEQQEKEYAIRTKVLNAMLYPSIILSALLLMVVLMLAFVIPKVTSVLQSYKVDLPLQTKILVWASRVVTDWWFILFPAIIALVLLFRWGKKQPRGKQWWDDFILTFPGIKSVVADINLARLTRSLNATLKSGLPIDQALTLSATVATHSRYQQSFNSATAFIRRGVSLGEVLRGYPKLYPPMATRMIEVGERTGKLDHMLGRLAVYYETEVDTKLSNLSSVIEPLLILVIGLVGGYVAISIMTAIWSFSQTV